MMAQSYANLEIVVSDNASPNGETERVVRELAARDPRIRYHRQATNIGPLANFGPDYVRWRREALERGDVAAGRASRREPSAAAVGGGT